MPFARSGSSDIVSSDAVPDSIIGSIGPSDPQIRATLRRFPTETRQKAERFLSAQALVAAQTEQRVQQRMNLLREIELAHERVNRLELTKQENRTTWDYDSEQRLKTAQDDLDELRERRAELKSADNVKANPLGERHTYKLGLLPPTQFLDWAIALDPAMALEPITPKIPTGDPVVVLRKIREQICEHGAAIQKVTKPGEGAVLDRASRIAAITKAVDDLAESGKPGVFSAISLRVRGSSKELFTGKVAFPAVELSIPFANGGGRAATHTLNDGAALVAWLMRDELTARLIELADKAAEGRDEMDSAATFDHLKSLDQKIADALVTEEALISAIEAEGGTVDRLKTTGEAFWQVRKGAIVRPKRRNLMESARHDPAALRIDAVGEFG